VQEVSPVAVLRFADGQRHGYRGRRLRHAVQPQTGFVWQSVRLGEVDRLLRPDEIVERVLTAARAWDDVVEVTALTTDELAGVLADSAIALEDGLPRERGTHDRHARVVRGDQDGRNPHPAVRRGDDVIEITDRQLQPLLPLHRVEVLGLREVPGAVGERAVADVEGDGWSNAIGPAAHGDERLLDRPVADGLPGAVEKEDDGFVENVGHVERFGVLVFVVSIGGGRRSRSPAARSRPFAFEARSTAWSIHPPNSKWRKAPVLPRKR
jgi:hypothetical protein